MYSEVLYKEVYKNKEGWHDGERGCRFYHHRFAGDTAIEEVLQDPDAVAMIESYIPGIMSDERLQGLSGQKLTLGGACTDIGIAMLAKKTGLSPWQVVEMWLAVWNLPKRLTVGNA
jgi:hypothetical protein